MDRNKWTVDRSILYCVNSDLFDIIETDLSNHKTINVSNYTWCGLNKSVQNERAERGSCDGNAPCKFKEKETRFQIIRIVCDTSTVG